MFDKIAKIFSTAWASVSAFFVSAYTAVFNFVVDVFNFLVDYSGSETVAYAQLGIIAILILAFLICIVRAIFCSSRAKLRKLKKYIKSECVDDMIEEADALKQKILAKCEEMRKCKTDCVYEVKRLRDVEYLASSHEERLISYEQDRVDRLTHRLVILNDLYARQRKGLRLTKTATAKNTQALISELEAQKKAFVKSIEERRALISRRKSELSMNSDYLVKQSVKRRKEIALEILELKEKLKIVVSKMELKLLEKEEQPEEVYVPQAKPEPKDEKLIAREAALEKLEKAKAEAEQAEKERIEFEKSFKNEVKENKKKKSKRQLKREKKAEARARKEDAKRAKQQRKLDKKNKRKKTAPVTEEPDVSRIPDDVRDILEKKPKLDIPEKPEFSLNEIDYSPAKKTVDKDDNYVEPIVEIIDENEFTDVQASFVEDIRREAERAACAADKPEPIAVEPEIKPEVKDEPQIEVKPEVKEDETEKKVERIASTEEKPAVEKAEAKEVDSEEVAPAESDIEHGEVDVREANDEIKEYNAVVAEAEADVEETVDTVEEKAEEAVEETEEKTEEVIEPTVEDVVIEDVVEPSATEAELKFTEPAVDEAEDSAEEETNDLSEKDEELAADIAAYMEKYAGIPATPINRKSKFQKPKTKLVAKDPSKKRLTVNEVTPAEKPEAPVKVGYNGKWLIVNENGRFFARLLASNGGLMLTTPDYAGISGLKNCISSVKKSLAENKVSVLPNRSGKFVFKVLSESGRVILESEQYNSRYQCEKALDSAKRFSETAIITE